MGPIRAHTKSRTGCTTCRRRRVKCDEARPACHNCTRRELECVYAPSTPPSRPADAAHAQHPRSASTTPVSGRRTLESLADPAIPSSTALFSSLFPSSPTPTASIQLDMTALELLHHYTLHTPGSLCSNATAREVWRVEVPRLGMQHDYLMHALLALSAAHLEAVAPSSAVSYKLIAANHYNKAVASFRRAIPARARSSSTGGQALFVASALISLYAFSCSPVVEPAAQKPGALFWIGLMRGTYAVLREYHDDVAASALAPLLECRRGTPRMEALPVPAAITAADEPVSVSDGAACSDPRAEARESAVYRKAIAKLKEAWEVIGTPDTLVAGAFMWPITMPEDYLQLLREKRPRALIVLAYYFAIIHHLDQRRYWWTRGRMAQELQEIEDMLGPGLRRSLLEWPTRIIRGGGVGNGGGSAAPSPNTVASDVVSCSAPEPVPVPVPVQ